MMAGQIGYWLLAVGYLHIQHMLSFPSHGAGVRTKRKHKGDMNMSTTILNEWTLYGRVGRKELKEAERAVA